MISPRDKLLLYPYAEDFDGGKGERQDQRNARDIGRPPSGDLNRPAQVLESECQHHGQATEGESGAKVLPPAAIDMIDTLFADQPDVQHPAFLSPRADFDCDGFSTALDLPGLIDRLFAREAGPCAPCAPQP